MKAMLGSAIVSSAVSALLIGTASPAWASEGQLIVRTQSGNTRCVVGTPAVACEYYGLPGFGNGRIFTDSFGDHHSNIASVTSSGGFDWSYGDIPGSEPQKDVPLSYGQIYHFRGWTLRTSESGTRFVNDATGHGMFVSIERVTPF